MEAIVLYAECPSVIDKFSRCFKLEIEQVTLPQKQNLVVS